MRQIDNELAKRDEERAEVVAAARHHVDEERELAQSTQRLSVDDIASDGEPEK
jgi:hypothetical protein